jgi:hypothetical protein
MANIRVRCPACNEELEIDERHEGEEIECGSCFEKFVAKAESDRPSRRSKRSRRDDDDDDEYEDRPRRRRRRSSHGGGEGFGTGGGGSAAMLSIVCGILSLPLGCCWCLGLPVAIAGIAFGISAMKDPSSKGMGAVGLVLSVIGLLLSGGVMLFGAIGQGFNFPPNQFGPPGRRGG